MTQRWRALTFIHWPYPVQAIQRTLPPGLTCDTFDGVAWVGLVPFRLTELHGGPTRRFRYGGFPETNVRTYVRGPDGGAGVWFYTLEAADPLAVAGARLLYRLPYRWASMRVERRGRAWEYRSHRGLSKNRAMTNVLVEPQASVDAGPLESFLTARFRLYTTAGRSLAVAAIEHNAWPLQQARLLSLEQNLVEACGLPTPEAEPLVHFSEDLHVRVDRLRVLR